MIRESMVQTSTILPATANQTQAVAKTSDHQDSFARLIKRIRDAAETTRNGAISNELPAINKPVENGSVQDHKGQVEDSLTEKPKRVLAFQPPINWTITTHKAEMPGEATIVKFCPPGITSVAIVLYCRGSKISVEAMSEFFKLLELAPKSGMTSSLSLRQIIDMTEILGTTLGNNQYACLQPESNSFKLSFAVLTSLGKTPALCVEGSLLNKDRSVNSHVKGYYIKGRQAGTVAQMYFQAPPEFFARYLPIFRDCLQQLHNAFTPEGRCS